MTTTGKKRGRPAKPHLPWDKKSSKKSVKPQIVEDENAPYKEPEILANQKYTDAPVVLVYKMSDRLNAKAKMKIFNNKNVDYVNSTPNLPGISSKAVFVELAVGTKFIEKFKIKYNIK